MRDRVGDRQQNVSFSSKFAVIRLIHFQGKRIQSYTRGLNVDQKYYETRRHEMTDYTYEGSEF